MKNFNSITFTKNENISVADDMGYNIIVIDDSGY